jgi:saccharopine dehydrogenase (NADP+, L-glutamate forming)
MLLMRHTFLAEYDDRVETLTSTMIDYGIENGDTSMSRTVTLPVAIAVRLVHEKKFTKKGIQIPTIPELYNPILSELEELGIKFIEKTLKVEKKN